MNETNTEQRLSQPPEGETRQSHLPILGLVETLEKLCLSNQQAQELLTELLRGFVALADAEYGAFLRVDPASRQLTIAGELMPRVSEGAARAWGQQIAELAAGVIQQSIIRYRAVSEPADRVMTGQAYTALAFPVRGDETVAGAAVIIVKEGSVILTDTGVSMLRLLADFGLLYSANRSAEQSRRLYESLSNAWTVVSEVMAFHRPVEMAEVMVNRARSAFGADRAAVGFVDNEKATIAAVSGQDIIDKRSNTVKRLQAVQMEVVVSGEAQLYHAEDEEEEGAAEARRPQHAALAKETGAKSVYSAPLRKDKDLIGVTTFEFHQEKLSEETRRVLDVLTGQLGPLLYLARLNARAFRKRLMDGAAAAAKWAFGREHPWRRAGAAAAVALVLAAVFGRCEFAVKGNCQLQPALRRMYSAPFDAVIKAAPVRPGDLVKRGDTVLVFEQKDLRMQLREAEAKLVSTEKEMASYLAKGEVSDYAEAKARRDAFLAQTQLLRHRLSQTVVKSALSGIVLTGDLRQHIGRPVRMGEELLTIAPLRQLLLEVYVAQDDVAYVEPGQRGRFTTKAAPNVALPFVVGKVRPAPIVYQGENVYVVEAVVENPSGALRSGMEGAAKILVGRRNVTWVATRKILNWLRLHLWW